MTATSTIFDRLTALADSTRSRLLLALDSHELTVSELCQVVQLPQSTVSRHLKILGDEGWVVSRAIGTSRLYRMTSPLEPDARALWQVVREQVSTGPGALQDAERLRAVLAERRTRSREFFSAAAGRWDQLRTDLFGQRGDLHALLGLLDPTWTVGDLGCGTGQLAAALAPWVARVIAVDDSEEMLAAARPRLEPHSNTQLRRGDLAALPIETGELDAAIVVLVLAYVPEPAAALAEAARVVRPGGRILVVDLLPHDRDDYRQAMGHLWQGFAPAEIARWLEAAGFDAVRVHPLPADPQAKGPLLFAATGTKNQSTLNARRSTV